MLNLNGYVWVAVLAALVGLYGAHRWVVGSEVREAREQVTLMYNQKMLKSAEKAAITSDTLRTDANNMQRDKDAKIASIVAERDAALKRLRTRPQRPPNYTPPAVPASSCTGRELYQEDGLFLRGEAARAEALIAERDYYYNQYENARKKLNEQ